MKTQKDGQVKIAGDKIVPGHLKILINAPQSFLCYTGIAVPPAEINKCAVLLRLLFAVAQATIKAHVLPIQPGRLQPVLMRPTPQLSVKTWGEAWLEGLCGGGGGGGIGSSAPGGGVPRWGGLRATHYYHMHTSRGDVCLGVRGNGGMYVIIAC